MSVEDPFAVLDSPVWHALRGPHRRFALPQPIDGDATDSRAYRYRPDVTSFAALDDARDPRSWSALAELVGPGEQVAVLASDGLPCGWTVTAEFHASQMVAPAIGGTDLSGETIVELTSADVDDMVALVELTKPGPFLRATVELGGYVGIRREGRLVAMAGRRLGPPGWREVSAVCTHPDHRGRGLSRGLVSVVMAGIRHDGKRPFLHVMPENTGAVALYESMGFVHRADVVITVVRPPGSGATTGAL